MNFLQPYTYFIVLSFLISLVVYFKPSPFYLKYFPPFLFATACVEIYAAYLQSVSKTNISIYNFFSVIEFVFYLAIVAMVTSNRVWKRAIIITIPLYSLLALVNIIFLIKKDTFHSITNSLGSLLIVIYCIHYFLELFRLAKWGKLSTIPAFWICSGLLFFYCCGFFYFGLMNYWGTSSKPNFLVNYYLPVSNILNIAIYTFFAIAFLCNQNRKYTLSSS